MALTTQIKQAREQKVAALKKSAEQAKEILALKEELAKAENFKTIEFENGLVEIRKEYESKISALEQQLKDLSERFAKQVQEIEALKTDNIKLKKAQEEKFTLEEEYNSLTTHAKDLENQIASYQKNAEETSLAKAKAAALAMQLTRVNAEKKSLSDQLDQTRLQIKTLSDNGQEARAALNTLRTQISENDDLITKLKQDITTLKAQAAKQEADNKKQQELLKSAATAAAAKSDSQMPKPPTASIIASAASLNKANTEQKDKTKTDSFTQTYTEPPTLSQKQNKVQPKAEETTKGQTKTVEKSVSAQNNAALNSANSDTQTGSTQESITPTQKEKLFNEIIPDTNNLEEETFAEASNLDNQTPTSKQVLDLSMIFGAKESIEIEDANKSNQVSQNEDQTGQVKLSSQETAPIDLEMPATDHSLRRNIPRRAAARNGGEYSDFLGKTKSVFYRIKWSLFKE